MSTAEGQQKRRCISASKETAPAPLGAKGPVLEPLPDPPIGSANLAPGSNPSLWPAYNSVFIPALKREPLFA
jgi:hypothetical protein